MADKATDSNQSGLKRDEAGRFAGGTPPAGFNANPQNISQGRWNKENSFSYQYNRFMNMTVAQLEEWNKSTSKSERSVAEDLAFRRMLASRESLPDIKEITDRVEGRAPQTVKFDGTLQTNNRYENLSPEEIERAKKALINNVKLDNNT